MTTIDRIRGLKKEYPQLCHASNILRKIDDASGKVQGDLREIVETYSTYIQSMLDITAYDDDAIRQKVVHLNKYYNFFHDNRYDNLFSAQGKFCPTILEEFLFLLFKDVINEIKVKYDEEDVLSSGSVKAYTNLYFKAKNFTDFIQSPAIGINEKDQDFAIYRTFDITINNGMRKTIQIPAVAIEAKTYIDKTMLDSIVATAEKLKSGNPYTRFVAVAERYDVSSNVDLSYSRIDQIYVLRKGMRKNEWRDIDEGVVLRLFHETKKHLERPWSDIQGRLEDEGVIMAY